MAGGDLYRKDILYLPLYVVLMKGKQIERTNMIPPLDCSADLSK